MLNFPVESNSKKDYREDSTPPPSLKLTTFNINNLDENIQQIVFSFLPLIGKLRLQQTSSTFFKAVKLTLSEKNDLLKMAIEYGKKYGKKDPIKSLLVKYGHDIEELNLSPWKATVEAKFLEEIMPCCPRLINLRLVDSGINDSSLKTLSTLKRLKVLNLSYNRIDVEGTKIIAKNLKQLTSLSFTFSSFKDEGVRTLAEGLPDLTELNLPGCQFGPQAARAIAKLERLTSLTLFGNDSFGNQSVRALATGLPALTHLSLYACSIKESGAYIIAERFQHLNFLNLGDNHYNGMQKAQNFAARLSALTNLDLSGWRINNLQVQELAKKMTALKKLNLQVCQIGVDGAKAIADLQFLTSLNLGSNPIGSKGAQALASKLSSLTELCLHSCGIGKNGAKAIAAGLPELTSLNLGSNYIGDDMFEELTEKLTKLQSLTLATNWKIP